MTLRDGAIQAMAEKVVGRHVWTLEAERALDALLDYLQEHEHEWGDAADEIPNASDAGGLIGVLRD